MCKERIYSVLLQKKTSLPSSQILSLKKVDKKLVFCTKNVTKTFIK